MFEQASITKTYWIHDEHEGNRNFIRELGLRQPSAFRLAQEIRRDASQTDKKSNNEGEVLLVRLHENVDPHGSARELVGDAHPALLPFWARGVFVTAPLGRRLASHLLHPLPLAAREKIWQAASALRGDGRARAVERSPLERRDRSGDRSPGVSAAARVVLLPALRGFALGCREARERSSARQHLRRSVRAGMRTIYAFRRIIWLITAPAAPVIQVN